MLLVGRRGRKGGPARAKSSLFRSLVDKFAEKMSTPRMAIGENPNYTSWFYQKRNDSLDMLTNDIDFMMQLFQEYQRQMVSGYFSIHMVIHHAN
ncbi:MAG: hypothetical protein ACJAU0_001901 [Flavobacteriales bacterium]|jgi:hypothetical protein